MGHSTNAQSQTALSHTHFQAHRNSNSPMQRQIHQPNYVLQNPNFLPSHHQMQQTSSYRAISPASSTNSDGGNRYIHPSFSNKQPPLLDSIHSARLSPIETVQSSTFQQSHHPPSSDGNGQVNVGITNLKTTPIRKNVTDCRLTINPVTKYAIKEREDPQSWAPLLKAAQQESSL